MKWTILWTDGLLYVMLTMLSLFIWRCVSYAPLRAQIADVLKRPINMAALYILVVYLILGSMDSVHFALKDQSLQKHYQQNTISVLDYVLSSAFLKHEETYSAPFAIKGFSKEHVVRENGEVEYDYPDLIHAGKHLNSNQSVASDIFNKSQVIFLQTMLIWGTLAVALLYIGARRRKMEFEVFIGQMILGRVGFPFKTVLLLLYVTIFAVLFIKVFSPLYYILGTSKVGEDVLYQSIKSIRTGLIIGTLTTLIMLPFATILGIMAGYFRGWIDDVIQYTYTTLSSIPGVLLIAAAVLTLQVVMNQNQQWFQSMAQRSDARLLALCAILGLTSWTGLCRLLRGEALKLRDIEYVQAAKSLGSRHFTIIFKHILPNVMHIILIAVVLDFSGLVLAEAVLSYVGVGVDPTTYSWGTMINSARLEMARTPIVWWSLMAAFIFMFILVLAANIFSDALRDALDPRTQTKGAR